MRKHIGMFYRLAIAPPRPAYQGEENCSVQFTSCVMRAPKYYVSALTLFWRGSARAAPKICASDNIKLQYTSAEGEFCQRCAASLQQKVNSVCGRSHMR
jgi:hypothetical protein